MKKGATLLLVVFIFLIFTGLPGQCASSNEYWPDESWRTSTPEEQGIDSSKLVEALRDIESNNLEIRSLLIIRHGYLVTECYRHPYTRDTAVNVKSVCKSIISALTGIALREKYLQNLDQKVLDFFPEYKLKGKSLNKDQITLRHLLTMTAGLETPEDKLSQWRQSKDWVKFVLDQPEKAKPGEIFEYSTGLTHVMSALITKTSGMSTLEFGRKYLFDPLGIKVHKWTQDSAGVYIGGGELFLTPTDMAKFGYLYLHNGRWNGAQIVPEAWVKESTMNQQQSGTYYGYWWWISPQD
ncbi:MAG TPA: serine hydrolase, partial [Bacillota bacterium]|nr:serine hydrolase [Bacillota bacterium]